MVLANNNSTHSIIKIKMNYLYSYINMFENILRPK